MDENSTMIPEIAADEGPVAGNQLPIATLRSRRESTNPETPVGPFRLEHDLPLFEDGSVFFIEHYGITRSRVFPQLSLRFLRMK